MILEAAVADPFLSDNIDERERLESIQDISLSKLPMVSDHESWSVFEKAFIRTSGEHLIGIGITGSGKTQKAYRILRYLKDLDTIVWFDSGKSGEILPLFDVGLPVNVIIPEGVEIRFRGVVPAKIQHSPLPNTIWGFIEPGMINVIAIERYFDDVEKYALYIANAFRELIRSAQRDTLPRAVLPMSIFYDEFQDVCPGMNATLGANHQYAARIVAFNLKKLRSCGVRVCAFAQNWTDILPAARRQFSWILVCRSAYFERDQPQLQAYNKFFNKIKTNQGILVFPSKIWSGRWKFHLYERPPGSAVDYIGTCEYEKKAKHGGGDGPTRKESLEILGRLISNLVKNPGPSEGGS
jgi:hypothetical protein